MAVSMLATHKRYTLDLSFYLMLCERSYLYLCQLYPKGCYTLKQLSSQHQHQLTIRQVEKMKYTSILLLNYTFPGPRHLLGSCQMHVRVYHDAQVVEVLAYQKQSRLQPRYDYPNPYMYGVDEKHQLNNLLHEWLYYWVNNCLSHEKSSGNAQ